MNEKLKKDIEAMSKEERMKRLDEISTELFTMANSFAGNETGNIAAYLHESVNNIFSAQKIFTREKKDEIPVEFIARACGLGMGTAMADLLLKDEKYREDLENKDA